MIFNFYSFLCTILKRQPRPPHEERYLIRTSTEIYELPTIDYEKGWVCMDSQGARMSSQTLEGHAGLRSQEKCRECFTVSSNEEVMAASTNLFPLMLARTDAPNPIDESWRLRDYRSQLRTLCLGLRAEDNENCLHSKKKIICFMF